MLCIGTTTPLPIFLSSRAASRVPVRINESPRGNGSGGGSIARSSGCGDAGIADKGVADADAATRVAPMLKILLMTPFLGVGSAGGEDGGEGGRGEGGRGESGGDGGGELIHPKRLLNPGNTSGVAWCMCCCQ